MAEAVDVDRVARLVADHVVDVPDFPRPGVTFKDVSPVFADPDTFRAVVDALVATHRPFDVVAGVEARGFVLGAAMAYAAGAGVVPVRKAGKLPRATLAARYELEYGQETLELHRDAFAAGARVLVVDDVLATGGTLEATCALVERAGAVVAGIAVLMEIRALDGRRLLTGYPCRPLLSV